MIYESDILEKAELIRENSDFHNLHTSFRFEKGIGMVYRVFHNGEVIFENTSKYQILSFLEGMEYVLNLRKEK